MTIPEHPFDPTLKPVFSNQLNTAPGDAYNPRQLCFALLNSFEHAGALPGAHAFIKQRLVEVEKLNSLQSLQAYQQNTLNALQDRAFFHITALPQNQQNPEVLQACLIQAAPLLLTAPCWLQYIPQAASSEHPITAELLAVFLRLSQPQASKAWLMNAGARFSDFHSERVSGHPKLTDWAIDCLLVQLALAQFPRLFFSEILGFTLAYCHARNPLAQLFDRRLLSSTGTAQFFLPQQDVLHSQISRVITVINDYLLDFSGQQQQIRRRILHGIWLYQQQMKQFSKAFKCSLDNAVSLQQRIAIMFQSRAAAAFGHHAQIVLAGKPLDQWFAGLPDKTEDFLLALRQSDYINTEQPANSRLLKLFEFNGPMFGVLDGTEIKDLTAWVTQANDRYKRSLEVHRKNAQPWPSLPRQEVDDGINFAALSYRELYYYLINAELYPGVQAQAKKIAQRVLYFSGIFTHRPFRCYAADRFDAYIRQCYEQEIKAYQVFKGKPRISRPAYIWGIEQLAPTVLTDGCWLQYGKPLGLCVAGSVERILQHIYCDEIGGGIHAQNHPYIYRQLLESLNISVPPVQTENFIKHRGFIDSAFDLPVYLLAIAHFPDSLRPELLGLNLAIELSGLGKVYLRLAEELHYWGIDAKIVTLHIAIDNIASGHAAQAIAAVKQHLDEVLSCSGELAMQRQWRRVYSGYCSLNTACLRFKPALLYHYGLKKIKG